MDSHKAPAPAPPRPLATAGLWLSRIFEYFGLIMIVALAILTIADVSMRSIFNAPIQGATEVSTYWFMVGLTLVGLWYAQIKNEHIFVTLFTERMSGLPARILDTLVTLTLTAFLLAIAWFGLQEAVARFEQGEYLGVLRTPIWPMRFVVVLGALFYAVTVVLQYLSRVRGGVYGLQEKDPEHGNPEGEVAVL